MFVWIFHRISGLLLIALLSLQLISGFFQASPSSDQLVTAIAGLHRNGLVVGLTVFLLVFHALYGVRTILLDLGFRREKLLFWCVNVAGLVIYAVFLTLFVTLV